MASRLSALIAAIWLLAAANAHTVITYPGWRGDNLITNSSWPYGMQWSYPCKHFLVPAWSSMASHQWKCRCRRKSTRGNCSWTHSSLLYGNAYCAISAYLISYFSCWTIWLRDPLLTKTTPPGGGMPTTTNRTKWPITGGAIALQPGWFQGHATAFFYMNLGFGTDGPTGGPPNMSNPMVPVFQIVGPSRNPYPGTFCLPQVPLPANTSVSVGDNATIQVVETAVHGAALYSVGPPVFHPNPLFEC
jgi:hypothetical protein